MKNIHYFTLHFTGFSVGASEQQNLLRLASHDRAFYTDKRFFRDPERFSRLKTGGPLHIGAHRMQDGSYWIHWLSDGATLIEQGHTREPLTNKFLLLLAGSLVCAAAVWPMFTYQNVWLAIVCTLIALAGLMAAGIGLAMLLHRGALALHPGMRDLLNKLELARQGNYAFCQQPGTAPGAARQRLIPFLRDAVLPDRYRVVEGQVKNPHFSAWSRGSGRFQRDYHGVSFQCDGTPLSLHWQIIDFVQQLHPIFRRRHPPFIASDDHVVAVWRRSDHEVQALYNASDGGLYLKNHVLHPGDRQMALMYKLLYGFSLFLPLIVLGMELYETLTSGSLALLDSWKSAAMVLDLFALSLLCVGSILVFLELAFLATRVLSSGVDDWFTLRGVIHRFTGQAGASVIIRELA
ncbi:hypothetical protein [Entomohabitans teleogrylli]|uniref:hypothetical protein n=1 Tax=Entomohabitans teleogrylli TaxID=1384589 RepID=UPI0008FC55B1|nr:hypothetical protein [Entomohabitans teleogrylli]